MPRLPSRAPRTAIARSRAHALWALVLVAVLTPRGGLAEDEFRAFDIDHIGGSIELRTEQRSEVRDLKGGSRFASQSLGFAEIFGLELGGSVVHPRLLQFDSSARLHLRQEKVKRNGEPDRDDRILTDGRLYVGLLQEHDYRFALSGSIVDDVVDPKFGHSYGLNSKRAGVSFSYVEGPLPIHVSYNRGWRKGDGERKDIDETREDIVAKADYSFERIPTAGELKYSETHSVLNFAVGGGGVLRQPIDLRRIEATNTTYFGAAKRTWFTGRVEFEDRSETITDRFARAFGTFNWTHGETLSSRYELSVQRRDIQSSSMDNLDASVLLRHRFWLSLVSQPRAWVSLQDASFGGTRRYGGELLEDYTKKLGDWGRISITLSPLVELARRIPTDETAFVVDEAVTLRDLTDVALAQRDIQRESIRVTDASGVVAYREDFDYRITVLGVITEIARLPTGDIADPETVLVDYSFRNDSESEILNSLVNADVRLQVLEWLEIHGGYGRRHQQLLSGAVETQLDSRERWVASAALSHRWISASAGFEDEDGVFSSFQALTQTVAVSVPLRTRLHAQVSATHRGLVYRDRDDEVSRWLVMAVLRQQIGRRSWLDIQADYQRERWSTELRRKANDRDAFAATATYSWFYRSFNLELAGRISWVDQPVRTEYTHRVSLRLRREF